MRPGALRFYSHFIPKATEKTVFEKACFQKHFEFFKNFLFKNYDIRELQFRNLFCSISFWHQQMVFGIGTLIVEIKNNIRTSFKSLLQIT